MSRPIAVPGFEPKDDVAGSLELKSFFRDGGPGDIAAKHFEFVALPGFTIDGGVERKACDLGAERALAFGPKLSEVQGAQAPDIASFSFAQGDTGLDRGGLQFRPKRLGKRFLLRHGPVHVVLEVSLFLEQADHALSQGNNQGLDLVVCGRTDPPELRTPASLEVSGRCSGSKRSWSVASS